jgi:hypothetical protein
VRTTVLFNNAFPNALVTYIASSEDGKMNLEW